MSPSLKFLVGLAAALATGWISHGPLGRGAAFVDQLQARADRRLQAANVPGVQVRLEREPLSRDAVLTGNANRFQREGMGSYPGINQRIGTIPGIGEVRWDERACCAEGR